MNEKQAISTTDAPAALGPYSQAIIAGKLVFASGQLGLIPQSGQLIGETVAAQVEQALKNLQAVLEAAGSSLAKVVKTTVFLENMDDFAKMNEIYARWFPEPFPARSCVAVKTLPRGAKVEIEAIALLF